MKKIFFWMIGILFLLACQTLMPIESPPERILARPSETRTESPAPIFTSAPTLSPAPTFTASPTSTPALVHQGPDAVTVPILLYHHVAPPKDRSRYYIEPKDFDQQMKLLRDWGYTTITFDLLLKSIYEGADLPARPLLITFDDGQSSVYDNAFPIMEKYGFTGVVYVVGSYMDAQTFMTTEQVKELIQSGWEVGSHSMSHKDLTRLSPDQKIYEIFQSRKLLSKKLETPVNSFAYPFGLSGEEIFSHVHNAGYTSAVGVGYTYHQGIWNVYLLQRRDILGTYDLEKFASFLPWHGDPAFLPTHTPSPIPSPTRTPRPTKSK